MNRWLVGGGVLVLIVIALWAADVAWSQVQVDLPAWAWLTIGLGTVMCFVVGGGLMGLIFYSSRQGYDEPPHIDRSDDAGQS
jgi:uncharacterized integral membrane protein